MVIGGILLPITFSLSFLAGTFFISRRRLFSYLSQMAQISQIYMIGIWFAK